MAQRRRILALLLALCLFASFLGTLPRASATEASLGIGTVDIGQPGKAVPIYDKPNGTPTHYLNDGTDVSILGMEKGKNGEWWYKVRYTPDVVGYIQSTNISTNVTPSPPSTSDTTEDDDYEMGTIVGPTPIYTYDSKKGLIRTSVSFVGGERVNLNVTELVTNTNGDRFYHFEFGELVEYVPALSAVRDSEREFHGRPGSIETYKGKVNSRVKTCLLVRSTPSETSYTTLDRLHCGDDVNIMDHTHIGGIKWYRLFRGNDPDGWVKAQYIDIPHPQLKHDPVDRLARIKRRTTAHVICGKDSANDMTFLGDELVSVWGLITIGGHTKQYYECEFGGEIYYVDISDVALLSRNNSYVHTLY